MLSRTFSSPIALHFATQPSNLLQIQTFGFSTLRKRLGLFSFKMTKSRKYKNPHAMSLSKRQSLQKQGYQGLLKIQETERLSERPFGTHTRKGRFRFNVDKVPFFNIPDLSDFKVSKRSLILVLAKTLRAPFHAPHSRRQDRQTTHLYRQRGEEVH